MSKKKIQTIVVDTLNAIQNNQYMGMLDKKTMVTRDKWKDFGVDIYAFMVEGLQSFGFETVLVLGYEGTGKSYGIRYLEPETNIWFNCDKKNPTFKTVVFKGEEVNARKLYGTKTNPTKFMPIPKTYSDILSYIKSIKDGDLLADNPIAFLIGHIEDYKSSDGAIRQRLRTLGNLATKMNIEGSVEYCLYSKISVDGDKVKYSLDTKNSGANTARASEGAFDRRYISNNFDDIYQAIINY